MKNFFALNRCFLYIFYFCFPCQVLYQNVNLNLFFEINLEFLCFDYLYQYHQMKQVYFQLEKFEVVITPSIGISVFPHDGDNAEILLKNSETAMYFAKHSGRCCYKFYQDSMNSKAAARLLLEQDLRQALKHGEVIPFYQSYLLCKKDRPAYIPLKRA